MLHNRIKWISIKFGIDFLSEFHPANLILVFLLEYKSKTFLSLVKSLSCYQLFVQVHDTEYREQSDLYCLIEKFPCMLIM
jgi:hypothetical protein